MIHLKLYSAPYDPNGKRIGEGPDFGPSWQERFNDYLEHGWFRNNIGAVVMKLMEEATWEKYEPYTYRDRDNKCHHAFMLKPATRFAMVVAENSRRGEYTWLPVQDAEELRADMVKSGWKMCDFRQFPALLKAFYIDKEDVGFAEGMRRFNKTVEVRYKKRVFNGKFDEIWPQLEPKEYNTTRLILAINKGLLARPLPYPDVPMFYTPRCSEEPALRDWVFTQRLVAEPYCNDGRTILPVAKGETDTPIICLRVTKKADGTLTLDQWQDRAGDYDDLLRREISAMQPNEHRWTLVLATPVWHGWPEAAFLPEEDCLRINSGLKPAQCGHEVGTTFGFELDGTFKTADLTEDAIALREFRQALIAYDKQTQSQKR